MTITHRAFFGTGERAFTLTDPMVIELERLTDTGIGALFTRMTRNDFRLSDLIEVIRLGLIGGGTNPEEAARLVDAYARQRPLAEILPLALDVLDAPVERCGGRSMSQIARHAERLPDEAMALAAAVLKRALRQKKEALAND